MSRACRTAPGMVSGSLRSSASPATDSAPEHDPATRFSSSSRRADRISRAPDCANRLASASPMPLDAPVIQMNFPLKFDLGILSVLFYKNLHTSGCKCHLMWEFVVLTTGGPVVRSLSRSLTIVGLALVNIVVLAQTQKPAIVGIIQGIVQSANTPLPGVSITATNSATNEKTITSTDLNGQYQLK